MLFRMMYEILKCIKEVLTLTTKIETDNSETSHMTKLRISAIENRLNDLYKRLYKIEKNKEKITKVPN